jgi:tRNA(Ile)-lysidine synthase
MKNGWPWEHVLKHLESCSSTIWIGLSGGMDSMVLLDVLSQHRQLYSRLKAIHVNHGLSKNADHWQIFCQQQCLQRNIPFYTENLCLKLTSNIEAQAREKRYQVFGKYARSGDYLVLAHHLDDQIETLMLNLLRGTGITGLAAMPQWRDWKGLTIIRPFLQSSRIVLQDYATKHQLSWIEDESNLNLDYSRNYLRHVVMPTIEKNWPYYRQSVLHTIEACQDVHDYVQQTAKKQLPDVLLSSNELSVSELQHLSEKEIMLILRMWFSEHGISIPSRQQLMQVIGQMIFRPRPDSQPKFEFGQYRLEMYRERLYLITSHAEFLNECILWSDFPEPLVISSLGTLTVESSDSGVRVENGDKVRIGFRQGGEKIFYKGHHRSLKKLLQQWGVPTFMRNSIPLLYVNNQLKAVIGYLYADVAPNWESSKMYHKIYLNHQDNHSGQISCV